MSAARTTPARLAVWALVALLLGPAVAAPSRYAPVPEALAALEGSPEDRAAAEAALLALVQSVHPERGDGTARPTERTRLVLFGDEGLRAVARYLAIGSVSPRLMPDLLHVVAVSDHPAADVLLARAATEDRAGLRMIAADGLGAGRTPEAIPALAELARDPVPGVRAVALRALFAIESPEAVEARQALPPDPRPDLHARRLRWHRLRGHPSPALADIARRTYREGRTPDARQQAALLLATPAVGADLEDLRWILREMGTDALGAVLTRLALGVPRQGYDPLTMRKTAILAAFVAGAHRDADEATRSEMLDRMIGWIARPVPSDPFETRPIPETVLRMILPDFGAAVVEPVVERLRRNAFRDPQDGVALLVEARKKTAPDLAAAALRGLLDPEASPPVPSSVRVAAAGGLAELGRIGDEALARRLLAPGEHVVVRRDVLTTLANEPGSWAVDLLAELIQAEKESLRDAAVDVLEARPEGEARALLVEHLFARSAHPHARIRHLVEPGDDLAYEVLDRALADDRVLLRTAGLGQLYRVPTLLNDRSRRLALQFEPRATHRYARQNELNQLLRALYFLAPEEGLAYVRDHWPEFVSLDWTATALRTLQHLKAEPHGPAVIDLVLERVGWDGHGTTAKPAVLMMAATALESRAGHRDGELDAFWRHLLTHENEEVVFAAVRSLEHAGRGDLTDVLLPLLEDPELATPDRESEALSLLEVLEHQPWRSVEDALVGLVLDENAPPTTRNAAGRLLISRASPGVRETLLAWLLEAETAKVEPSVQRIVARIAGTGGGAAVAARVHPVLEERLLAAFQTDQSLDPDERVEVHVAEHVRALARAIAFTRHVPSITKVARLLFLPRFAVYARRSVERQGTRLGPVDASAAARRGPTLNARWHRTTGSYGGLPYHVWAILDSLKAVPDEMLAACFAAALQGVRASGDLAAFPDVYLDRLIAVLHDKPTGDLETAAAVIERHAWPVEPVGGAVDFGLARDRANRLVLVARYEEAIDAQARVTQIAARRSYDDEPGIHWKRERALGYALEGALAAQQGRNADATALFDRARARHPDDTHVLGTAARLSAATGHDLDAAEADATRALTLERRVSPRAEASIDTTDAMAVVLIRRERFLEAAELLDDIKLRVEGQPYRGGRVHLHLAEALAGAGYPDDAADALLTALDLEPTLAETARDDPRLEPLRADGRLDSLLEEARTRFLVRMDED